MSEFFGPILWIDNRFDFAETFNEYFIATFNLLHSALIIVHFRTNIVHFYYAELI